MAVALVVIGCAIMAGLAVWLCSSIPIIGWFFDFHTFKRLSQTLIEIFVPEEWFG